jgi:hypothetical protein
MNNLKRILIILLSSLTFTYAVDSTNIDNETSSFISILLNL